MKKLLLVLFPLFFAQATTEVYVFVVGASGQVVPDTSPATAQFVLQGVDSINVWINGVAKGRVRAPFTTTYTSLPIGQTNVFVIEYCDFVGRLGTNTFTMVSQPRTYNKRII